jgi:hypothetical protein
MNFAFSIDQLATSYQMSARCRSEQLTEDVIKAQYLDLRDKHWEIFSGSRGMQVVSRYFTMLLLPLNSSTWQLMGRGCADDDVINIYLQIHRLMCNCFRRLVFRFRCCPFETLELGVLDPHSERWTLLFESLLARARACSQCVDLSLTHVMLDLGAQGHVEQVHRFLSDYLVAARPSSCSVEQNHLVNHTLQIRGRKRGTFACEVESLIANINKHHHAVKAVCEETVHGDGQSGKTARKRFCQLIRSSTVTTSAAADTSCRRTDPTKRAKRIMDTLANDRGRPGKTSGWNLFYKSRMGDCSLKVTPKFHDPINKVVGLFKHAVEFESLCDIKYSVADALGKCLLWGQLLWSGCSLILHFQFEAIMGSHSGLMGMGPRRPHILVVLKSSNPQRTPRNQQKAPCFFGCLSYLFSAGFLGSLGDFVLS